MAGHYFKRKEVMHYINLLITDVHISKFLEYDKCCRLADNYLLATVFVYLKRSGLSVEDYSFTNFFAGLLLAHAMIEENDYFVDEIIYWALPNYSDNRELVKQLQAMKFFMFQAMGFRGLVSQSCCDLVMSVVSHQLWSRKRDQVHAGVYKRAPEVLMKRKDTAFDWLTGTCKHCRKARQMLRPFLHGE